ncbi:3-hydroxyacyl-CoA dehydrogenase NAD-binding domain-containing protein [Chloracidobacterium aggregatum]|uniref:3-hydroxyacyl-CoA dehydrogenase NAD-binding domain-containing protein n=1 Tax=Chloracidobacterium aggregatum TaxID=2851959 RepID=UPI00248AA94A|nr:3-hydroxyacyl-CoA dehydrogenase NAD-binding domain-containing protein [Chloracidobacterium aggregatum]
MAATLARIHPTTKAEDLRGCELIIEAVLKTGPSRRKPPRKPKRNWRQRPFLPQNTSTLPITSLAQVSERPGKLHRAALLFARGQMPLVEIIVGEKTSPETLARSFDFVRQIKKTPIVVQRPAWVLHLAGVCHLHLGRHDAVA